VALFYALRWIGERHKTSNHVHVYTIRIVVVTKKSVVRSELLRDDETHITNGEHYTPAAAGIGP